MKTNDFIRLIDEGKAKVLTLQAAKELKGKPIYWMYFGYKENENTVVETKVGEITTKYEVAKNTKVMDYLTGQPSEKYSSQLEMWEKEGYNTFIKEALETQVLLDANGINTNIVILPDNDTWFDEPTFTCSDADRCVFYIEKI